MIAKQCLARERRNARPDQMIGLWVTGVSEVRRAGEVAACSVLQPQRALHRVQAASGLCDRLLTDREERLEIRDVVRQL